MWRCALLLLLAVAGPALGQGRFDRYALILEDPPLVEQVASAKAAGKQLAAAMSRREAAQGALRELLAARRVPVTGSTRTLLNAVYVHAPADRIEELRRLPGVARIARLRPWKRHMNRAVELVNAVNAWNSSRIGGIDNAGAGVKIAILDTGIDHTHPAFQDPSLKMPAGYPRCSGSECDYTNNKVIAARSYVPMLVLGDMPEYSRPDDLSPRDRVGHGTATAMIAAGVRTDGPSATVSGVAPKAFLGNYKIFGSPGVNDVTFDDVIFRALEDAVSDGMDIAVLAVGSPALWGPNDQGQTCGLTGVGPCDLRVEAVRNAARAGLAVIVSAGNDGDLASKFPALNSIHTPGSAPEAITVGATTNAHIFFASVRTELTSIPALFGDGPTPGAPLTAPLKDVAKTEPDGKACRPVGAGTLTGAVALIERGDCSFATKVIHAQQAGAVGVVIVQSQGSDFIFPMTGLSETGVPAVMIGSTDGQALRNFLASNPDRPVTLDPRLEALDAEFDTVAFFSSRGPGIGENHIKPDLVAVGTDLYVATQNFDPNGDMWAPDRYTAAQGTSFAAPMVAGALALVKQLNPGFTPAQLKSAAVNTAGGNLSDFDAAGVRIPASVTAVGAGKLNVEQAILTTVTVEPATLSFGAVSEGNLPSRGLVIRNAGAAPADLRLAVEPADARISLSQTALSLGPGASQQVSVSVTQAPPAGSYEGFIVIRGGPVELRVPYLYVRGDGVPFNVIPLSGFDFVANVEELIPGNLIFKVVDRFGVPVPDVPVQFSPPQFVESVTNESRTDSLGIIEARVYAGPNPGEQTYRADLTTAPDLTIVFPGRARLRPAINANGVVNAASFEIGNGLAPGSLISIFGTALSEATRFVSTAYLPLSMSGVSVSFDVPERGISVPGRLHYVGPTQINLQIPWELEGLNSAQMKVSIGPLTESALYSVPLNRYGPAFFERPDPGGSGRQIIAASHVNGRLVSSQEPARPDEIVLLFANGLGPVDNRPPSGELTPLSPLSRTLEMPTVTVGGSPATVEFSGLAPTFAGLYQLNIRVPRGLEAGRLYEVILTIGGVRAKTAFLPVG